MTYWGAPSPGGEKFYKGSSQDSAWNHDLLWKLRVEKEVDQLDEDQDLGPAVNFQAGVADRTWSKAEENLLREAVRAHGAGSFDAILNSPHFVGLRHHSEDALREKWRHLEKQRYRGVRQTRAQFRRTAHKTKRNRKSGRLGKSQMSRSASNLLKTGWRGSGKFDHTKFQLKSGNTSAPNDDLTPLPLVHQLKDTILKQDMLKSQLADSLKDSQKLRDETRQELMMERKSRRRAERALRKYQRVLGTLLVSFTGLF